LKNVQKGNCALFYLEILARRLMEGMAFVLDNNLYLGYLSNSVHPAFCQTSM